MILTYEAKNLRDGTQSYALISGGAGNDQWWAPVWLAQRLSERIFPDAARQHDLQRALLTDTIHGQPYCAVYVGEVVRLRDRVREHLTGTIDNSTLRHTLAAVVRQLWPESKAAREDLIDQLLDLFVVRVYSAPDAYSKKDALDRHVYLFNLQENRLPLGQAVANIIKEWRR